MENYGAMKSIAERRAEMCGFDVDVLNNIARLRNVSPLTSPPKCQLSVTQGVSPSALLDSPVMLLSNPQVQQSPTTGALPVPQPEIPALNTELPQQDDMVDWLQEFYCFEDQLPPNDFQMVVSPLELSPKGYESYDNFPMELAMEDARTDGLLGNGNTNDGSELMFSLDDLTWDMNEHTEVTGAVGSSTTMPPHEVPFGVPSDGNNGGAFQENVPCDVITVNDDESDSKRRKLDGSEVEEIPSLKTIHEDRIIIKTECKEGVVVQDGYRWKKYGQKMVKGNSNPRSYYKCTGVGCPVKKHVERCSNDRKYVIATYDGKHNHGLPSANKVSSSSSSGLQSAGAAAAAFDMGTMNWAAGGPYYHLQDPVTYGFYNSYLGSNILGTSTKKFPALPSSLLYDQYLDGLNANRHLPPPFPTSLLPSASLQQPFPSFPDQPDVAIPTAGQLEPCFPMPANDWA